MTSNSAALQIAASDGACLKIAPKYLTPNTKVPNIVLDTFKMAQRGKAVYFYQYLLYKAKLKT